MKLFNVISMYPPGNQHIPPWEKESHLQNAIFGGYVSYLEGDVYAYFDPLDSGEQWIENWNYRCTDASLARSKLYRSRGPK